MFGLDDEGEAERFDELAASGTATYRSIVEALGEHIEGGYFLYRFADPTYVVGHAVVRAVAEVFLRWDAKEVLVGEGQGAAGRFGEAVVGVPHADDGLPRGIVDGDLDVAVLGGRQEVLDHAFE